MKLDDYDRQILKHLQRDATMGLDPLADAVHLSRNACWRRVKALEDAGIIRARVALLDADKLELSLRVFIQIRTNDHSADWADRFARLTRAIPQILSVHRMSGDLDYLIQARVASMQGYDALYQRLSQGISLSDVSASFVMEDIKDTTELPL